MTLKKTARTMTIVVIGKRSNSPGTASRNVPRNTQAAATDMMIGGLDRKPSQPVSGVLGAMLTRNNRPNTIMLRRSMTIVLRGRPAMREAAQQANAIQMSATAQASARVSPKSTKPVMMNSASVTTASANAERFSVGSSAMLGMSRSNCSATAKAAIPVRRWTALARLRRYRASSQ